ncbi:hypothetical protein CB1_001428002 [Camelus ferus]|nr:hypothetical protein CB1_001428002 [Camelus ferus]
MASGPNMMDPICLLENDDELLSVNQEALQILGEISQPVVVVAIVGLYRTGKSYLMNRLAGQNSGFPLGSTVQSETKGIWMWCVPHPCKPNHTLVLLDTEGLGDVEKGDPKNDSWIFALAVLLCSSFVYNNMNTINHQSLEQLQYPFLPGPELPCFTEIMGMEIDPSYVTELTELIRAKSSQTPAGVEDSTEFVSFFPDFIWTVRDFTLELKLNGQPVTEDEYLENALKLIPGKNPKAQASNLPRERIRQFFPRRKCFVFDRPTNDKELLANIETVPEDQLDPKFQEQTNNFCSYIFANARTKTLTEGIMVTGKRLRTLVVTYVDTINSGAVPCLENAVTTLAQLENSAAVQKAADHYSEQMAQRVSFPTDTLRELLEVHAACEREATAVFMEHSFKDDKQEFQKNLVANEVLQSFLQSQVAIEKSILQADKALTDGEKAIAEERARKDAAEKAQELLKQKLQEQQQEMEAQNRSLQEHIVQLTEKLARERENLLRQQNMMLEHKLKRCHALVVDEQQCLWATCGSGPESSEPALQQSLLSIFLSGQQMWQQSTSELAEQQVSRGARRRRRAEGEPGELRTRLAVHRPRQASVMITDEQEECCMKEGDLLCDTGETSAAEWARREAAERGKEPLEQKVKLLQQKLDKEEIAFEEFRVKMTEEIRECDDLLRKVDQSIKELEASVMITDEQEECCMKKSELLCDAGKTSAAEWARREAAERGKEPLEEKIKELQQMLEDQERVSEGFRAQVPEEMKEREKTSAAEEWARRAVSVCLKREKVPLEQKVKELQRKLHKQERAFQRFRAQVTKEIIERDRLRKKMNKRIESLEALLILLKRREKCCIKKDELCCVAVKTLAAEWARREAAERGKEPLEEKIKELQQMLEDQESVSEGFRPQIPEEMKEREKTSAEDLDKKEVEREMELLKQKIKELQQMLEDQESVSEGFRPQIPEEMKEREKTSAEDLDKKEVEREMELLKQKIKELQQMLEDQESVSEGFRPQIPEEMKEREKTSAEDLDKKEVEREMELLKQKIKELQQMLEDQESVSEGFRPQIPEEMKEREKTSAEEEPNKREEAEREEESLEQNVKGLQQKLEDRQTDVNGLKAQVTEGISKREKTSAGLILVDIFSRMIPSLENICPSVRAQTLQSEVPTETAQKPSQEACAQESGKSFTRCDSAGPPVQDGEVCLNSWFCTLPPRPGGPFAAGGSLPSRARGARFFQ